MSGSLEYNEKNWYKYVDGDDKYISEFFVHQSTDIYGELGNLSNKGYHVSFDPNTSIHDYHEAL